MTTYRVRLRDSGKVERVFATSYIITNGVLTFYKDNHTVAEFNKSGWTWVKVGADD
jgi:hypothetical protein